MTIKITLEENYLKLIYFNNYSLLNSIHGKLFEPYYRFKCFKWAEDCKDLTTARFLKYAWLFFNMHERVKKLEYNLFSCRIVGQW